MEGTYSFPLRQQQQQRDVSVQESKGLSMKMPIYDGSGDIDTFFIPFGRLAERLGGLILKK